MVVVGVVIVLLWWFGCCGLVGYSVAWFGWFDCRLGLVWRFVFGLANGFVFSDALAGLGCWRVWVVGIRYCERCCGVGLMWVGL